MFKQEIELNAPTITYRHPKDLVTSPCQPEDIIRAIENLRNGHRLPVVSSADSIVRVGNDYVQAASQIKWTKISVVKENLSVENAIYSHILKYWYLSLIKHVQSEIFYSYDTVRSGCNLPTHHLSSKVYKIIWEGFTEENILGLWQLIRNEILSSRNHENFQTIARLPLGISPRYSEHVNNFTFLDYHNVGNSSKQVKEKPVSERIIELQKFLIKELDAKRQILLDED